MKKRNKKVLLTIIMVAISVSFIGCNDNEENKEKWLCTPEFNTSIILEFDNDTAIATVNNASSKIVLFTQGESFKFTGDTLYKIEQGDIIQEGFIVTMRTKDSVYLEPFGISYLTDASLNYITVYPFKKL